MQHRENCAIGDGVQELCAMPARGHWSCLGFSIANHCDGDEIGMIENRAKGMRNGVTKFSTFVQAAWCFWCCLSSSGQLKIRNQAFT
jgi:hypothetical protein